jgi:serine/threonine-protein kinase RIO1
VFVWRDKELNFLKELYNACAEPVVSKHIVELSENIPKELAATLSINI